MEKEQQEKHGAILDMLKTLLDEFCDLYPKEQPDELPPLRNIQHHMDFNPDAKLPNLSHKMELKEHEILQNNVKDVLGSNK